MKNTAFALTDERGWKSTLYDKLARLELVEKRQEGKTLYGLLDAYKTSQLDVTAETHQTYLKVFHRLRTFFREDIPLPNITKETAAMFVFWLRTEPWNHRSYKPQPHDKPTVNRRISIVYKNFRYTEKIKWMGKIRLKFSVWWNTPP